MVRTQPPRLSPEPILNRILREAWSYSQAKRPFLAVFDLDSTLFDLTLRISTIVADFETNPAHRAAYPEQCEALKKIQIRPTDWGLEGPLKRAGIDTTGPFFKVLHDHTMSQFFSDDYLAHDQPLPGAVDFVIETHQAGAHVMYLTGRDVPRMLRGTEMSLRLHGFPVGVPGVELVLKPDAKLDDAEFKRDVLKRAEETYERIWLFENEPVNLNLIARDCPEIGLVFIDSVHSGREELQCTLDHIKHFEVDLEEFRRGRER